MGILLKRLFTYRKNERCNVTQVSLKHYRIAIYRLDQQQHQHQTLTPACSSSGTSNLSKEEVITLASSAGLKLKEAHLSDWAALLGSLDPIVNKYLEAEDYTLQPDLTKYPRTNISIPSTAEESDQGGWATKVTVSATSPTSDLLKGKTVAIKDNVALAGVRCTNGTEAVTWTPQIDAPIVTRILDAGGIINGKAACENGCMEGISDTSCTGNVHNPFAPGYSCGGSSSGSGRVVASGQAEMSIGCDQGGSIRIPASMCGLVGLKPTWGLVPYTGILSLEGTIDHAGPIAKTVRDCAVLLEAIAGPDGIDDRQPAYFPEKSLEFTSGLDEFVAAAAAAGKEKPLAGVKVGVLEEGYQIHGMCDSVSTLCKAAVDHLATLGAEIKSVSIPLHLSAAEIWMISLPLSGTKTALLGVTEGRKTLHMLDRAPVEKLSDEQFQKLGPGAQNLYMRYLYMKEKWGAQVHAKSHNLLRKINDAYDAVLADVDVLIMPTLPSPACKLFDQPNEHGPLERMSRNVGMVGNTAPFNSTGHPALTVPVGFVPALEDESVKLPAGLQIVGRKFKDLDCLKVGAAWESSVDWKTFGSK